MPSIAGGNPVSLGLVNVDATGTPELLTKNFSDMVATDAKPILAASVFIQAKPGNTGLLFFGDKNMVIATGVGVFVALAPGEAFSLSLEGSVNPFNIANYQIDANNTNDKAYVSYSRV